MALALIQLHGRKTFVGRLFLVLTAGACVFGCSSHPGSSHARAGSLSVDSTIADTAAPAIASRTVDRSTVTIPAGSVVEIASSAGSSASNPPAEITYKPLRATLAAPAQLVREVTRDELATAIGHKPPSPVDLAKGFNVRLWGGTGLALAILALALVLRSHLKAAAIAFVGSVVVPLVGHFVNSTAGLVVAGVSVAAAVAFFAAWHVMRLSGRLVSTA